MVKLIEKIGLWFEIFFFGVYKIDFRNDSPVILDGGANAGVFSKYCKIRMPNSKIIAVEPNPKTFSLLKNNLNKISNVTFVNKAITLDKITHISDGPFSWSNKTQKSGGIEVEGTSLKELLNIFKFDHIKLDIEGCEYATLADAKEKLNECPNYSIELHEIQKHQKEIIEWNNFFKNSGYKTTFKFFLAYLPLSLVFLFPSSVVFTASKQ